MLLHAAGGVLLESVGEGDGQRLAEPLCACDQIAPAKQGRSDVVQRMRLDPAVTARCASSTARRPQTIASAVDPPSVCSCDTLLKAIASSAPGPSGSSVADRSRGVPAGIGVAADHPRQPGQPALTDAEPALVAAGLAQGGGVAGVSRAPRRAARSGSTRRTAAPEIGAVGGGIDSP